MCQTPRDMVKTQSTEGQDGAVSDGEGLIPSAAELGQGAGVNTGHVGAVENAQSSVPQAADTANLLQQVTSLIAALTQQLSTAQVSPAHFPPRLHSSMVIPTYSGYCNGKSVADFLLELDTYRAAFRASDEVMLRQVLPVALEGDASRWWRLRKPFSSMADFQQHFEEDFLPPDYAVRVREELALRTQHADESLIEFVRAIQELYSRTDPKASDQDKVSRAI